MKSYQSIFEAYTIEGADRRLLNEIRDSMKYEALWNTYRRMDFTSFHVSIFEV